VAAARQRTPPRPAEGGDGRCAPERKARAADDDAKARHGGSSDAATRLADIVAAPLFLDLLGRARSRTRG
jgi:hypothetical protein